MLVRHLFKGGRKRDRDMSESNKKEVNDIDLAYENSVFAKILAGPLGDRLTASRNRGAELKARMDQLLSKHVNPNTNGQKKEDDEELSVRLNKAKARFEPFNLSYAELLDRAAAMSVIIGHQEDIIELYQERNGELIQERNEVQVPMSLEMEALKGEIVLSQIFEQAEKTIRAKKAADKGHDQEGGSRYKQAKMRAIFATGKHKNNRDECARKECEAIGMSFSSARKALKNTPNPT